VENEEGSGRVKHQLKIGRGEGGVEGSCWVGGVTVSEVSDREKSTPVPAGGKGECTCAVQEKSSQNPGVGISAGARGRGRPVWVDLKLRTEKSFGEELLQICKGKS